MKFIPGPILERWGACHVYNDILKLFPGEPGVPISVAAVETILDSNLYPNPARWAGYLLAKTTRWEVFRAIMESELLAEWQRTVRLQAPRQAATLRDMAAKQHKLEELRRCAEALLGCVEPRRMAQPTVLRVYTHYAVYLGGAGTDRNPGQRGPDRTAVLWMSAAIVRVMDREPDNTTIDPRPDRQ